MSSFTRARPHETVPSRPLTSTRSTAKGEAAQTRRDRRGPHSTHPPPTTAGAIEATTDRTYGQAQHEHPPPRGGRMTSREQPNPPASLRSEVAALPQRVPTGLRHPTRFTHRDGKRKSPHVSARSGPCCHLRLHEPLLESRPRSRRNRRVERAPADRIQSSRALAATQPPWTPLGPQRCSRIRPRRRSSAPAG
jgi:hypothetical protein